MQEAFDQGMEQGWGKVAEYYADTVEVRHVPPAIGRDGMISREKLFELADMEFRVMRQAMPDIRLENAHVYVQGDEVVADTTMVGTTHQGGRLSMRLSTAFSFEGEQICRGVARTLDFEGVAAMGQMVESMMVESGVPRIVALILRIPLRLVFSIYWLFVRLFLRRK